MNNQVSEMSVEETLEFMERTKWKRVGKALLKDWRLYALLIPLLVFMFMFKYLPIKGVLQAFKNNDGNNATSTVMHDDWFGLTYVKAMWKDAYFWRAVRNTFVNSMYGLVLGFPIPIFLALLFSEIKSNGYRSVVQVFSYLPKFLSTVVTTSIIIIWCKKIGSDHGLLTKIFLNLGFISDNEEILTTAKFFRPIYQISGVWEGAGYGSIVYFAAVLAISPTNYEAARIDGANKLQQIRYVTLPSMAPTLSIMLIMRIGQILNVGYEKVMLLYQSETYETADVISTYVYRQQQLNLYSIGTAADFLNSLIAMCLVLGANAISRKISDTSLF